MNDADRATDSFDDINLVPNNTDDLLNERQYLDYRSEREYCLEWLLTFGKEPEKAGGYAKATVSNRAYRMDQFTVDLGAGNGYTTPRDAALTAFASHSKTSTHTISTGTKMPRSAPSKA